MDTKKFLDSTGISKLATLIKGKLDEITGKVTAVEGKVTTLEGEVQALSKVEALSDSEVEQAFNDAFV